MIIPKLTDKIVIDEIPEKPINGVLYLLSRPIINTPNFNDGPKDFKIYTTRIICRLMACKKPNKIPPECLHPMLRPIMFNLGGGRKVRIDVIETGSASANVMFIFDFCDGSKTNILYTGQFKDWDVAKSNQILLEKMRDNCISYLYFDASLANSSTTRNCLNETCQEIRKIFSDNPEYKIRLQFESLGYEDVLVKLARDYNIVIGLNLLRFYLMSSLKLAHHFKLDSDEVRVSIYLGELKHKTVYDKLYKEDKIISVQLIASNERPHKYSDGLIQIPYSEHASLGDLIEMINLIAPVKIYAINAHFVLNDTIPGSLHDVVLKVNEGNIMEMNEDEEEEEDDNEGNDELSELSDATDAGSQGSFLAISDTDDESDGAEKSNGKNYRDDATQAASGIFDVSQSLVAGLWDVQMIGAPYSLRTETNTRENSARDAQNTSHIGDINGSHQERLQENGKNNAEPPLAATDVINTEVIDDDEDHYEASASDFNITPSSSIGSSPVRLTIDRENEDAAEVRVGDNNNETHLQNDNKSLDQSLVSENAGNKSRNLGNLRKKVVTKVRRNKMIPEKKIVFTYVSDSDSDSSTTGVMPFY